MVIFGKLKQVKMPRLRRTIFAFPFILSCQLASADSGGFFLQYGTAETLYARDALTKSYNSFFGSSPDADTQRRFDLSVGGESGALTPGGAQIGIGYQFATDYQRIRLISTVEISSGKRSFHLPEGAGIFHDPAKINLVYQQLTLSQEISTPLHRWTGFTLDAGLGGGVILTRYKSSISSALLDIDVSGNSSSGFAQLFLNLRSNGVHTGKPELKLVVRTSDRDLYDVTLVTRFHF
ncbi:hypothetical protein [Shimia sp.]|uniref:hypothetical protein n=1 Tax=Shimia sp. TaxID=1954381 RepID=UPI0032991781